MTQLLRLAALCSLGCLSSTVAVAQAYAGIGADFGGFVRAGQWSEVYGPALATAFRAEFGTQKSWLFDAQAELLYGREVLIDPLVNLRTDVGILGDEGAEASPANVSLKARGFRASLLAGKKFPLGTRGFGFRALAGPSYLEHHIRIQDDAGLTTSNLRNEYKRGYDRRASGWGGSIEIGLQYQPPRGSAVFFIVSQGHIVPTKPMRSVQFDLGEQAPAPGTDAGLGLKVGVVATLFSPTRQQDAEQIYY